MFTQPKSSAQGFVNQRDLAQQQHLQQLLTFYTQPPTDELDLDQFVTLGRYRQQMLKEMTTIISKHSLLAKLESKADKSQPSAPSFDKSQPATDIKRLLIDKLQDKENLPQYDTISHYILMLSACDSDARRLQFKNDEAMLFRWRAKGIVENGKALAAGTEFLLNFAQEHGLVLNEFKFVDDLNNFKRSPNLSFKPKAAMIQYFSERTGLQPEQLKLYSLSFSAVLDLFCHDKTKVVVLQGKAYITQHSLVDILCKMYRDELDKKLDAMKQHLDYIKTHHHLLPSLLRDIQFGDVTSAANSEYTPSEDLKKEDLPVLVPRSFPLCMQRLYNHVTREHHVRHFGRGQLNLFFKQIGLPLDQALDWWRAMFSPKYPGDKFDKEYAYTFRHNYGQEGKRANYSAPGCGRLITTEVGPTDSHGCPFKHLSGKDPNAFKVMLTNVLKNTVEDPSVRDSYVLEIQTLCADGHYQVACGTLFRYTHNGISAAENITHPVQYYRQSHEYYKDLKEKAESKDKVATGVQKEPQMMTLE